MSPTDVTVLSLAAWTILMVMSLGVFRTSLVFRGQRKANDFTASGDELEDFGKRLTRAHANCYEALPIAASVLLYAIATEQTAVTNGLAFMFLGARIAQSVVHVISTSVPAVLVRFVFFLVQLIILAIWILTFLHVL